MSQATSFSDSDAPSPPSTGRLRRACHRDGTRASAAASELEIAAALAAAAGRAPAGRFSGREGKLARIRAQEAAFAALRGAGNLNVNPNPASSAAGGLLRTDAAGAPHSSDSSCETAVEAAEAAEARAGGGRPQKSKAAGATALDSAGGARGVRQPKKRRKAEGAGEAEAGGAKRRRGAGADLETGVAGPGRSRKAPGADGADPLSSKQRRKAAAAGSPAAADAHSSPDAAPGSAGGAAAADPNPVTEPGPVARNPAAGPWWGAGRFVSAGCLEGLGRDPAAARERRAFDEDDQAGLYMAAHAAKTANKKGLGTRTVISEATASVVW